jgi:S1-C subfamily serine protease
MKKKYSLKGLSLIALFYFLNFCSTQKDSSSSEFPLNVISDSQKRQVTIFHDNDMPKGSGFFINSDGFVLTAFHVVGIEPVIQISEDKETFYPAKVVYVEKKFDLALLSTEYKKKIPKISWMGRLGLQINDPIFVIASPLGLINSFMKGYISQIERLKFDLQFPEIPYIQTYGTSFEGVSGAAVYSANGSVIGLNRATFGTSFGNSFGLVVPVEFIHVFFKEARKAGVVFAY